MSANGGTRPKHPSVIAAMAALQGAAGVSLAAAAAHVDASPLLATASQFLMIHAAAGLALAALVGGLLPLSRWLAFAAYGLQAGVTLFAADLASRAFWGAKLFPFAAPTGGSLTILSWIAVAAFAIAGLARRD